MKSPKQDKYSILDSPIWHKNSKETERFCKYKNWDYELVSSNDYFTFLEKLGGNKRFIFLPKTPETLSRVVVEAKMMGMSVTTNKHVGATKEDWFKLEGEQLINRARQMRQNILNTVLEAFK